MKTLSAALILELNLVVTRPGYLVHLGYPSPYYLSTLGDVTWNNIAWNSHDVKVSGISQDGKGSNSASLALGNTLGNWGVTALSEGVVDIPVNIWAVYAGAPNDAVQVFSGVMDGCEITADKVNLVLVPQGNKTLESPRVFISPPTFNFLQPEGTRITCGNETFVLTRK